MDFGVLQKSSKHFLIFIFFPPPLGTSGIDQLVPIFHNFVVTNKFCQYLYTIHQILDPPLTISSLTLFSFYCFAEKNGLVDFGKKIVSLCLVNKNSPLSGGKKNSLPSGKNHSPP